MARGAGVRTTRRAGPRRGAARAALGPCDDGRHPVVADFAGVDTGFAAIRMREAPGVSPGVLFAPMVTAAILAALMIVQGLRADGAQRALAESEERFRLAVEAARCGIWEWDLVAGELYMSDITGAMLGWGGGGVAPTVQVLERVAPEHRERVRQAIAAAMAHGAFDVSFRVQRLRGRGLDRRARPGGRRARDRAASPGWSASRSTSPRSASPRCAPRPPRCACRARSRACRRPSCSGTGRSGWCSATRTSAASSRWSRGC